MAISILDTEAYFPGNPIKNSSLIESFSSRASSDLSTSLSHMDITQRYSIIENFEDYILGKDKRILKEDTNSMMVKSIKKLYQRQKDYFDNIGLFLTATDTASRPMPCTAFEVMSDLHDIIPENTNVLNIQNQGCSVFLKMVSVAQSYLVENPDKVVLLSLSEAHTGFMEPLKKDFYQSVRSLKREGTLTDEHIMDYHKIILNFLFGDGCVSLLLQNSERKGFTFGKIVHCTNRREEDKELLTMNNGGILYPEYEGFPYYAMSPKVPERGSRYSDLSIKMLKEVSQAFPDEAINFSDFFIHTGSKKILNGVFTKIGIDPERSKKNISYRVLNSYGNLSACSIPLMIHKTMLMDKKPDLTLIISFGVGFSASSAVLKYK